MMLNVKKRHQLLLEVLIAVFLIAVCIVPLIYPQTFILVAQKRFIQKAEIDNLANLLYADLVERMYRNEIPWGDLFNGTAFPIDSQLLERIKFDKTFPYKGVYTFQEIIHKPKTEATYYHYLFRVTYTFVPVLARPVEQGKEVPGTLHYTYEMFVVRDLTQGQGFEGGEEEQPEQQQGEQQGQRQEQPQQQKQQQPEGGHNVLQ